MNSLQNYLERMGSNFLVAAMIPSLTFVILSIYFFGLYFPTLLPNLQTMKVEEISYQAGFLVVLFTIIIGFTLSSLNTFVYKLFEGYVFLWRFPGARNSEIRRAKKLRQRITHLDKRIAILDKREENMAGDTRERLSRSLSDLRNQRYILEAYYQSCFPFSEDEILPTRFGNCLKAAEAYSRERYEIDAVPLWPRLIHVIPDSYYAKLDAKNNQLSFLLNCSLLCIIFAFLSFGAFIHQLVNYFCKKGNLLFPYFPKFSNTSDYWQYIIMFLAGLIIALIAIRVFYVACVIIVAEYGDLVRATFDLFRADLLVQLNLELPKNSLDERNYWRKISRFVTVGPRDPIAAKGKSLEYHYRTKEGKETS